MDKEEGKGLLGGKSSAIEEEKGKSEKTVETPLMKQFFEIKSQHPDAILLFRVGDFYETFGEDAVFASKVLDIVLTRKASGSHTYTELAGFPYHALDTYLYKLVKAGGKVAICEQLEDPKQTRKLVKRGVTELITPGISFNDRLLEKSRNNFLCGISPAVEKGKQRNPSGSPCMGVSFLDVSTGEFFVAEGSESYIRKLLDDFQPSEIVLPKAYRDTFFHVFGNHYYLTVFDDWVFRPAFARETLLKHFRVNSLKGFGIEAMEQAQIAAAACLHYLSESKHEQSSHIASIQKIVEGDYVWMDAFTLRNLEVLQPAVPGADSVPAACNSLYAVLNRTSTPMGGRLLRRFLMLPLKEAEPINRRLDYVDFLFREEAASEFLAESFQEMGDLERLLSKVAALRAQPRELLQLKRALESLARVIGHWKDEAVPDSVLPDGLPGKPLSFAGKDAGKDGARPGKGNADETRQEPGGRNPLPPFWKEWVDGLDACPDLIRHLAQWVSPDAPAVASKGNVIAPGADPQLDELRKIAFSGKEYLAELLQQESRKSGIPNLKLGFNNVYGYYLEVTHSYKEKVPSDWVRKQTLTNAERYITQELKAYEEKVLDAQARISGLEASLYQQLLSDCCSYVQRVQKSVQSIAFMDVMNAFAKVSKSFGYVRPKLEDGYDLEIVKGRHPVIEQNLEAGQKYVPNDIRFHYDSCRIMMITGPNMSGKSAVLRQTALIVLMAQAGCFVPAEAARIGLVDKIFTRVGATDNISSGESTFMVEMNETANILNNLTGRSLVLLDEIGRGTSTYDGISIAWAIAEYLHQTPKKDCKVLFATHYHELNQMASRYRHIRNYHVKVKEVDDQVIFLRTLEEGGSEHSFGIHVAEMAGMPPSVVAKARQILSSLENSRGNTRNSIFASPAGSLVTDPGKDGNPPGDSPAAETPENPQRNTIQHIDKQQHKPYQLSFIQLEDPLLEKIRDEILGIDVDTLTPVQALNKLDEIKRLLKPHGR